MVPVGFAPVEILTVAFGNTAVILEVSSSTELASRSDAANWRFMVWPGFRFRISLEFNTWLPLVTLETVGLLFGPQSIMVMNISRRTAPTFTTAPFFFRYSSTCTTTTYLFKPSIEGLGVKTVGVNVMEPVCEFRAKAG